MHDSMHRLHRRHLKKKIHFVHFLSCAIVRLLVFLMQRFVQRSMSAPAKRSAKSSPPATETKETARAYAMRREFEKLTAKMKVVTEIATGSFMTKKIDAASDLGRRSFDLTAEQIGLNSTQYNLKEIGLLLADLTKLNVQPTFADCGHGGLEACDCDPVCDGWRFSW